jgi:hypothetical protein
MMTMKMTMTTTFKRVLEARQWEQSEVLSILVKTCMSIRSLSDIQTRAEDESLYYCISDKDRMRMF